VISKAGLTGETDSITRSSSASRRRGQGRAAGRGLVGLFNNRRRKVRNMI
jgi:hypothetical protein